MDTFKDETSELMYLLLMDAEEKRYNAAQSSRYEDTVSIDKNALGRENGGVMPLND